MPNRRPFRLGKHRPTCYYAPFHVSPTASGAFVVDAHGSAIAQFVDDELVVKGRQAVSAAQVVSAALNKYCEEGGAK